MLLSRILLPRKHKHLRDRNYYIARYLERYKVKDSVLDPSSDTAAELMHLDNLEREMRFNNKLNRSLLMWFFLSLIGIRPKI
jgi:hypothetical protein